MPPFMGNGLVKADEIKILTGEKIRFGYQCCSRIDKNYVTIQPTEKSYNLI